MKFLIPAALLFSQISFAAQNYYCFTNEFRTQLERGIFSELTLQTEGDKLSGKIFDGDKWISLGTAQSYSGVRGNLGNGTDVSIDLYAGRAVNTIVFKLLEGKGKAARDTFIDGQYAASFQVDITCSKYIPERYVPYVEAGTPCALEGERVYVQKGEDQDVYECNNLKWTFLFMRLPGDQD